MKRFTMHSISPTENNPSLVTSAYEKEQGLSLKSHFNLQTLTLNFS